MRATDATDVLTRQEVADWLQIEPRQVERFGVPCIPLGRKTIRYLRGDVLAWLRKQRSTSRTPRQGRRNDPRATTASSGATTTMRER